MSETVSVDLETGTVRGKSGDVHRGDYLILAAGGLAWSSWRSEYACLFYSLVDAQKLRFQFIEMCEAAELQEDESNRDFHIVIVGGGPTGVEIAGALVDLMQGTSPHLFSKVDLRHAMGHHNRWRPNDPGTVQREVAKIRQGDS